MQNTIKEQERIEAILNGNANPELDCKTFYNEELCRMAVAILNEDFSSFPFQIDIWRNVMKENRLSQLRAVRRLVDAEMGRITYCQEQIKGGRQVELVHGVYLGM